MSTRTHTPPALMKRLFLNIWSPVLALCLWETLSRTGILNPVFFPPPSQIVAGIYGMWTEGTLTADVKASLSRIAAGLFIGGLPAFLLGILAGRNRFFGYMIRPLVSIAYPIPKIALIPLVILFFGIGELSKIVVIAMGAFFLVFLNTYHGVNNMDRGYFDVARIYDYSRWKTWRYIIIPGALPDIFNGIKLAIGMCFILVVAAEFIGGSSGIGYRIWTSWESFDIKSMFSALTVLASLGWGANITVELIEKHAMPWRRYD